jgi:hypothetical protein
LTGPDIYSPEVIKRERNDGFKALSTSTRSSTDSEDSLYAILNRLGVAYLAKEPVRIYGEFFVSGEPVTLIPDALVIDRNYEPGVFEVDGKAHKTQGARKWDERKNQYYCKMWLWVERVQNKDVKQSLIGALLSSHKRKQVEFP